MSFLKCAHSLTVIQRGVKRIHENGMLLTTTGVCERTKRGITEWKQLFQSGRAQGKRRDFKSFSYMMLGENLVAFLSSELSVRLREEMRNQSDLRLEV